MALNNLEQRNDRRLALSAVVYELLVKCRFSAYHYSEQLKLCVNKNICSCANITYVHSGDRGV